MKKLVLGGLILLASALESQAQSSDTVKIGKFIPMTNFGWSVTPPAKSKKMLTADVLKDYYKNRAMVVEYPKGEGDKTSMVSDTLIFEPVMQGDTIPADGRLTMGTNESGLDVHAYFYDQKALCFMNTPAPMDEIGSMPFRLVKYDRNKHDKITHWTF